MLAEKEILESEIININQLMDASKAKIEETRDQFKLTFDKLYSEIEEDSKLYDQIL
jgi:predicted HicB family RNase H-like nuclease